MRRSDKVELNQTIAGMLPAGFEFAEIDIEGGIEPPAQVVADKTILSKRGARVEQRFITIERMRRGLPYKITIK